MIFLIVSLCFFVTIASYMKKKKVSSFRDKIEKKIPKGPNAGSDFLKQLFQIFVIIAILSIFTGDLLRGTKKENTVSLSELATLVENKKIKSIEIDGDELSILYKDGKRKKAKKEQGTALSETLRNYGVSPESLKTVSIEVKEPSFFEVLSKILLPGLIPFFGILFIVWFFVRQMKGANKQAIMFGNSRARVIFPGKGKKKDRVTFKDVAGNENAKQELQEMVEFLKNPKKFIDMGAKIPKGILLTGDPGTGKTLMAKAVAGEANVPFFYLSGSDFVEMFVGVGASRVRDLFKTAKKMSPSIIFIDEIDAVGRSRGVGIGGGNDEREQTLNQILVEMDGFETDEKVIVMAATNRPDVLDKALLRPGRFDRQVHIDLPDRKERLAILQIHAKGKPFADDVKLEVIAERTAGFSGADLESVLNEAAIIATMAGRKKIQQEDLINAFEKVLMGPKRKSHLATEEEKKITAYHEAGHAIVASVLPHADPVHKVTIIPRGRTGGFTMKLPLDERKLTTKSMYRDEIAMTLGGYAAELKMFGDITTGPSNDLKVASSIARMMVTRFGMSDEIGPIVVDEEGKIQFAHVIQTHHSDSLIEKVDSEVQRIVREGLERAKEIIDRYYDAFVAIAEALLEKETLEREEYNNIIRKFGIQPKEKKVS